MNLSEILEAIRRLMLQHELQALVVTHNDAHASEYIAAHDERLAFVSNFTGSAGTALITLDKALLWTDGRYFTQAVRELPVSWTLMKSGEKDVPTLEAYLASQAKDYGKDESGNNKKSRQTYTVGIDAETSTMKMCERIQLACDSLEISLLHPSIVDTVWTQSKSRPAPKHSKVVILEDQVTGRGVKSKLDFVKEKLAAAKCDAIVISALDDIAWILNARGDEIPFNPVFFGHMIISKAAAPILFSNHEFKEYHGLIEVRPYASFLADASNLFGTYEQIWVDPNTTSMAFLWSCLGRKIHTYKDVIAGVKAKLYQAHTCVRLEKPKKTVQEIDAMKRSQVSDGAALCRFLNFLSKIIVEEGQYDEYGLSEILEGFRKREDEFYVGKSFETISSFGENGAVVHYKPKRDESKRIQDSNVYLCDSGGHYSYGGTTDTTRTVWLGGKSSPLYEDARRCYTYVLKAHVALAVAIFPSGISPSRLDSIPRAKLWSAKLDYNHGTGHGVGCWLCVHELPPLISSTDSNMGGIVSTMCVTNEPGYYEEGKFGFRIENLMLVSPVDDTNKFCKFETITLVPYCRDLIDKQLLTDDEVEWINAYHAMCRDSLMMRLSNSSDDLAWLMKETAAL